MQRIEARVSARTSGYDLFIHSVYQVDHQLIVISVISTPRGGVSSSYTFPGDIVIVHTGSHTPLKVVHYLMNDKNNSESFSYSGFIPLQQLHDIKPLLDRGQQCYAYRKDKMTARRLRYMEAAEDSKKQVNALAMPTLLKQDAPVVMDSILNIFTVVEQGAIKIMFEKICKQDIFKDARFFMNTMASKAESVLALEDDFQMITDNRLSFYAIAGNEKTRFDTVADEFTLPLHKPESVLYFMMVLDAFMMEATHQKDEYDKPCTHVQISQQSVLSCFDDLVITAVGKPVSSATIENQMEVSMETFLQRPGTTHQPASVAVSLMKSIVALPHTPALEAVQAMLSPYCTTEGIEFLSRLSTAIWLMYRLKTSYTTSAINVEKMLPLVESLEALLGDERLFELLRPFFPGFKDTMVFRMIEFASYGHPWDENNDADEYELLRHADFQLREDGRLSLLLANNPVYQTKYNDGCPKQARRDGGFKHFAKSLRCEFDADSDMRRELIFSTKETRQWRALGLHLSEAYCRAKLVCSASVPKPQIVSAVTMTPAGTGLAANPFLGAKKPLPAHNSEAFRELQTYGLRSATVLELVQAHPACEVIVPTLRWAGLFTDDVIANKSLFANLIHMLRQKELSHLLAKLYTILGGETEDECWLTPGIQQSIRSEMMNRKNLEAMIALLETIKPFNQPMLDQLFEEVERHLMLWEIAQRWKHPRKSFCLVFKPGISAQDVHECSAQLIFPKRPWLTRKLFCAVLENMRHAEVLLRGFDVLHQHGLLESHADRLIQHPLYGKTFFVLQKIRVCTAANVCLSIENAAVLPAAMAVNACYQLVRDMDHKALESLFKLMMRQPEMGVIAHHLHDKFTETAKVSREASKPFLDDMVLLLQSTGMPLYQAFDFNTCHKPKPKVDHFSLFSAPRLLECIKRLSEKYQLRDDCVQVQMTPR